MADPSFEQTNTALSLRSASCQSSGRERDMTALTGEMSVDARDSESAVVAWPFGQLDCRSHAVASTLFLDLIPSYL